jgi:hypothetical protein
MNLRLAKFKVSSRFGDVVIPRTIVGHMQESAICMDQPRDTY